MGKQFTIGQLAYAAEIPTTTVRYYERVGLVEPEDRSAGNYRLFSEEALRKLKFIRAAQAIGFTLDDVRILSAAYFASSVFYIKLRVTGLHAKKPDDKRRARWQCVGYHGFLLVSLLALAITRSLPLFLLIAFAPVLARTAWSLLKPSKQLNLKRIGIAEIIYSLIFLIFTAVTLRYS